MSEKTYWIGVNNNDGLIWLNSAIHNQPSTLEDLKTNLLFRYEKYIPVNKLSSYQINKMWLSGFTLLLEKCSDCFD